MKGNEGEAREPICWQWDDSQGTSACVWGREGGEEKKSGQYSVIKVEHLLRLSRNLLTENGLYNQATHPLVLMKQLPAASPKGPF